MYYQRQPFFLTVFLAILAALASVVFISIREVGDATHSQSFALANEQARATNERITDRLDAADNFLLFIADTVRTSNDAKTITATRSLEAFSDVALVQGANETTVIKGVLFRLPNLDEQQYGHLRSGKPALIAENDGTGARIVMMRHFENEVSGVAGLLFAKISPEYLWRVAAGEPAMPPAFCINDAAGQRIHCEGANASSAEYQSRGVQSRVEVGKQFGGGDWLLSVTPPAIDAAQNSGNVVTQATIVAGVIATIVSLLLAQWSTRKFASGGITGAAEGKNARSDSHAYRQPNHAHDAETPLTHGTSSNLASRSGGPSDLLFLFSEIDRAILSGVTFDRIVDSIIPVAHKLLGDEASAIVTLDKGNPASCRMVIVGAERSRQVVNMRDALDAKSTAALDLMREGTEIESSAGDAMLAPLCQSGMQYCFLFPMFKDGVPVGALIIAKSRSRQISDATHRIARDIAQRLGVAYTSATRGQELLFHSLYDSTTELPNRKFFELRLEEEISRARRESRQLALLLIDLDEFKKINDSFGHDGGDILLEEASARLKSCLRAEDLVARVGNDEFGVMLPTISGSDDASRVAKKLLATLSQTYSIGGRDQHLSATIGIAVFPEDGKTSHALFRSADFAMNSAKKGGGARYSTYEPHENAQAKDQAELANDLRSAIARNELMLYFQPQIDLTRGEIVGAEALVRWQHHSRGLVMPASFIAIAEQSDLIEELGSFVRREAGFQFRRWENEGTAPARISVNVSSREFKRADFVDMVEESLRLTELRPFSLELEITESLLVESSGQVAAMLKALSDRGVRIAIDDFGTGYSSMAYLKDLPFHVLKIDRSFVKGIGKNDGSESIIDAIIGMAKGMGKELVAEGIETEAQRAYLARAGCEMAQGYLWSPPVPATEFATFIHNWNNAARKVASIT